MANQMPSQVSYVRLFLIISCCFLFANLIIVLYYHTIDTATHHPSSLEVGLVWGFDSTVGGVSFIPITGLNYIMNLFGQLDENIDFTIIATGTTILGLANLATFFGLGRAKKWSWNMTLVILAFNLVFSVYVMILQRFVFTLGPSGFENIARYSGFFQALTLAIICVTLLYLLIKIGSRKYFMF